VDQAELIRRVELKRKVLQENSDSAARLRERFRARGTLVVNLISSPGSGKTALLEATAHRLSGRVRMAAVVGDVATELDADRLVAAGLPARQISTGGSCHLDARLVAEAIEHGGLPETDLLFIENVGNLICPTAFDLGEDEKVALLSVTEGPDKPVKYPGIFSKAGVVVITKTDLQPLVDFDLGLVRERLRILNPGARVLETSAKRGEIGAWCDLLSSMVERKQQAVSRARGAGMVDS
jgi:hydrogenase nickel incorporation protein HypB